MRAMLGSNRQMSVGADSTIAPLFAVGIAHLASIGSGQYADLVGVLSVMVGAFVALVWLLRLGWIAEFSDRTKHIPRSRHAATLRQERRLDTRLEAHRGKS